MGIGWFWVEFTKPQNPKFCSHHKPLRGEGGGVLKNVFTNAEDTNFFDPTGFPSEQKTKSGKFKVAWNVNWLRFPISFGPAIIFGDISTISLWGVGVRVGRVL